MVSKITKKVQVHPYTVCSLGSFIKEKHGKQINLDAISKHVRSTAASQALLSRNKADDKRKQRQKI